MADNHAPQLHWCPLPDRVITRVDGPDAREFLQNVVTNDLDRLESDRALYAALLTPQGMYLHDFLLTESNGAILLDSERERQPDLARKLALYRLRSKATIEIDAGLAVGVGFGAQAAQAAALDAARGHARSLADGIVFTDPRSDELGVRVHLPEARLAEFFGAAGFAEGSRDDYDRHRLSAGIPDGSRDLVIGRSYLLESNFDLLDGVSFSKGCYIGQENTARQRYRGTVRRRLARVAITSGPVPDPGTPIRLGNRDVGTMRSSQGSDGLAHVRLALVAEAAAAGQELDCGDAKLRIRTPIPEAPSAA